MKSKTGNIGFVGGVEVPLIKKFEAGYTAGAKAVNPDIKVQVKYLTQPPDFSGFGDPAKGKTAAAGMFDAGADVVYQAAGGSGGGVFEAAKAAGGMAIGVDSDQYNTADPKVKDVIMTSMLKKVDVAVYDFIKSVVDDKFTAGPTTYDLEKDGVGYSTSGGQIDDITHQAGRVQGSRSSRARSRFRPSSTHRRSTARPTTGSEEAIASPRARSSVPGPPASVQP